MTKKEYKCKRCNRPIYEGRATYTMYYFGEHLCGSQTNPTKCVDFAVEDRRQAAIPH